MRRKRVVRHYKGLVHIAIIISLAVVIGLMIWLIPPSNMFLVSLTIFLITLFCYVLTGLISRRIQIATTLFIPLFFSLNLLVGFEILNTVLLGSIIIAGVGLLPRNPPQEKID